MKTAKNCYRSFLLLLFLFYFSLTADTKGQYSEIKSFSITPASVNVVYGPANVKFSLHVLDEIGCDSINVTLSNWQNTNLSLVSGTVNDGIYEGTILIPQINDKKITLYVNHIYTIDKQGVKKFYNETDFVRLNLPYSFDVYALNPNDKKPPELTAFSITPSVVNVNSGPVELKYSLHVKDSCEVSKSVSIFAYPPTRLPANVRRIVLNHMELTSGSITDGDFEGTVTIPQYAEAGEWTITNMYLNDFYGNTIIYNTDSLLNKGFPAKFVVESSVQDLKPPVLESFSFSPSVVNTTENPAEIKFTMRITDDITGSHPPIIRLLPPSGELIQFNGTLVSGTANDGIYEYTYTIPKGAELGDWKISWLFLSDDIFNYGYAYPEKIGFPSKIQVIKETNTPEQLSPLNGSISQPVSPDLKWNSAAYATSYHLQVSTDEQLTNLIIDDSTLTGASKTITGLAYNTKYYWRVKAANGLGISPYSPVWNFITIPKTLAPPVLLSPGNNALNQPNPPDLVWNAAENALSYHLQVSADSLFANIIYDKDSLTNVSQTVNGLLFLTKYFWRVSAKTASGTTGFSETRSFTTTYGPLGAPKLVSPLNNSANQPTDVMFNWEPVERALSYYFVLATDDKFENIVVYSPALNQTTVAVRLQNNTKYFWKVNAKNTEETSPFSQIFSFSTVQTIPAIPILIAPADTENNLPLNCLLQWSSANGAAAYWVQVSGDQNFNTFIVNDSTLTVPKIQLSGLKTASKYYWRVKAVNAVGKSEFSGVRSFSTVPDAPHAPALNYPPNNEQNKPVDTFISWHAVIDAGSYQVQVSSDSSFSTLIVNDSSVTFYSKNLTNLENNKRYYWRVKAKNAGGTSPYSEVWSFTTVVAKPLKAVLNSPVNGFINMPLSLAVKWNKAVRAQNYTLQVSKDSVFTNMILNDSTLTDTTKLISGLSNDTKYFWKVRARNNGGYGPESDIWSFRTIIAVPGVPIPDSPLNQSAGLPIALEFKWRKILGIQGYNFQLSKDSLFLNLEIDDANVTDTLKMVTNLRNNTKYYWRVSSRNIGGVSQWSPMWSFTTVIQTPDKPLLVSPLNKSDNQSTSVLMNWRKTQRAAGYNIQLCADTLFKNLLIDERSKPDSSQKAFGLKNNTTYYWRIQAVNEGGAGPWSDIWTFRTIKEVPNAVLLAYPVSGSKNIPVSLSLKWNKASTAESYTLKISKDTEFADLAFCDSSLTDTVKQVNNLTNYTRYYWKVQPRNTGGLGQWSETRDFTTIVSVPKAPVLIAPSKGLKDIPLDVKFSWRKSSYSDMYKFHLAEDENFTKVIISDSSVTDTLKSVKGLTEGRKYYWRINGRNIAGESPFSEIYDITTILNMPDSLKVFALGKGRLKLTWKDLSNAETGFIIERKQSSGFEVIDSVKANITEYTDSTVTALLSYNYRIRAYSSYAFSDYSNEESVTVTGVNENKQVPVEYSLLQNYPNPFNPVTVIRYGLPKESMVKLVIYNSLGETIRELVHETESAGFHEVSFDAHSFSSGVYYYSIEAKAGDGLREYREIKKMILLK